MRQFRTIDRDFQLGVLLENFFCSFAGAHTSTMVANSIPQGQVKAGDKIVNDVKLTNIPAGRFDGQLRPYSQADVEKLR